MGPFNSRASGWSWKWPPKALFHVEIVHLAHCALGRPAPGSPALWPRILQTHRTQFNLGFLGYVPVFVKRSLYRFHSTRICAESIPQKAGIVWNSHLLRETSFHALHLRFTPSSIRPGSSKIFKISWYLFMA